MVRLRAFPLVLSLLILPAATLAQGAKHAARQGARQAAQQEAGGPRVTVMPVFFVPSDEAGPTPTQSQDLMRHLRLVRDRYKELLGGTATFQLAAQTPLVYKSRYPLAHYRREDRIAAQFVPELLSYFKVDEKTCSKIFVVVLMNPHDNFPAGGGRPINGGFGTGGGALAISSRRLEPNGTIQGLLQHELGHTFGLPHPDAYGYDQKTNASIMAYNPAHRTHGFNPAATPGVLIPEDRRGLALNQRVFPGLTFDEKRDVPAGYRLARLVKLGPMDLDFTSNKPHERDTAEPDN